MPSHAHAKRILWVATSVALIVLTLAGLAFIGVVRSTAQGRLPTTGESSPTLTPAHPSSGRLVVAVALGASGTVGSDALAPFEVFASSPRSPSTRSRPAPHRPRSTAARPSFPPTRSPTSPRAEPSSPTSWSSRPSTTRTAPSEAALRAWVVEQSQHGARILGVCAAPGCSPPPGCCRGGPPPATGLASTP